MIFPGEILQTLGVTFGRNISPLTAANFVLSAGWGSTATVTAVSGTSGAWQVTVTANGAGIAANPTLTLTYEPNSFVFPPFVTIAQVSGGTGAITDISSSSTISAWTMIYNGTPTTGQTYIISGVAIGK